MRCTERSVMWGVIYMREYRGVDYWGEWNVGCCVQRGVECGVLHTGGNVSVLCTG